MVIDSIEVVSVSIELIDRLIFLIIRMNVIFMVIISRLGILLVMVVNVGSEKNVGDSVLNNISMVISVVSNLLMVLSDMFSVVCVLVVVVGGVGGRVELECICGF